MLVDCLTLWLSNLLLAGRPLDRETRELCRRLREAAGPVVLVANEVGHGPRARDAARPPISAMPPGRLNQEIAALADRVVFVAAGLPLVLKEG